MDSARAKRMSEELIGEEVRGWKLLRLLDFGKSALVIAGEKGSVQGAVKIFDPELVERFGYDVQRMRVDRELELHGHNHPNLIQILDGGEWPEKKYLYVVMERVDWPPIDRVITGVPREKIWPLIEKIASAAKFLEGQRFAHRDIKPSNIVVSPDFTDTKLLDLGVIRPFGKSDLTDDDARHFIGTLRYSSPEFLLREEADTMEGWRAVTFYQLGAVLHDLIMRKPLFQEFSEPYALLVRAVREEMPRIEANDVEGDLVVLAKTCLTKDPKIRLRYVSWDKFSPKHQDIGRNISTKWRLQRRQQEAMLATNSPQAIEPERLERRETRAASEILNEIESITRKVVTASELLPPARFVVSQNPETRKAQFLAKFEPSQQFALDFPLAVFVETEVIDINDKVIKVLCAIAVGPPPKFEDFVGKLAESYVGIYDTSALREHIDSVFHGALDAAQVESCNPEEVKWLSLDLR